MRNCFIIVGSALLALAAGRMAPAAGGELRAASVVRVDSRTGRLVRRVVPPAQPRAAGETFRARAGVDQLVAEAARRHNVDPLLVHSVIQVESNYNPFAVSAKGARGLMQLVPATARRFGVRNPFDPKQNIDAGVRYLKHLQDTFHDTRLALAAYNAGEGAVTRYRWIPPYPETWHYVERVGKKYGELRKEARQKSGSGLPEAAAGYRPLESFIGSDGRLYLRTR